jgi:hypothetical protein
MNMMCKRTSHLLSLNYVHEYIIRINKNRIPETKITEGSPSRNITRKIDHDPHKLRIIFNIFIDSFRFLCSFKLNINYDFSSSKSELSGKRRNNKVVQGGKANGINLMTDRNCLMTRRLKRLLFFSIPPHCYSSINPSNVDFEVSLRVRR